MITKGCSYNAAVFPEEIPALFDDEVAGAVFEYSVLSSEYEEDVFKDVKANQHVIVNINRCVFDDYAWRPFEQFLLHYKLFEHSSDGRLIRIK